MGKWINADYIKAVMKGDRLMQGNCEYELWKQEVDKKVDAMPGIEVMDVVTAYQQGWCDALDASISALNDAKFQLGKVADRKTEPQTDIHDLTDCDFCKDRNCKDCEGGKDEPQIIDWGKRKPCTLELFDDDGNYIEPKDKPQTENPCDGCVCDDGKHLMYCMNCKGIAWKTEPPKIEDEPQTEEPSFTATDFGKGTITRYKDEPQTDCSWK